jgi:hypothetical protein
MQMIMVIVCDVNKDLGTTSKEVANQVIPYEHQPRRERRKMLGQSDRGD